MKYFHLLLTTLFSTLITSAAYAEPDPVFFPPGSPQRRMCDLLQKPGVYLSNPVLDCDDASWLLCLQFGGGDCWQFGAFGPGVERPNRPTHDFSHAMVIIRDPNNPNRFCAFEPYGCEAVHCWESPTGDPSVDYPADDIRQALCQLPVWRDVLDCNRGPVTIEPPRPGHVLDPTWGGEPGWWQCGSFKYQKQVCYNFRDQDGEVRVKCLPLNLDPVDGSCEPMLDPENPASVCFPGTSKICRNEEGQLRALYCCNSDFLLGSWCLSPSITDYPRCSSYEGAACNPRDGGFIDCVRDYPLGPVPPNTRSPFQIVPTTTLQCEKCVEDDFIGPPAPGTPEYCWKGRSGGLANVGTHTKKTAEH